MSEAKITYIDTNELLSIPEFAVMLGGKLRVMRMIREGEVPHLKRGRGRITTLHPLEICWDWYNGKPVAEHWMRGGLAAPSDAVMAEAATA